MYLRETKRRNADGSSVSYLALAQNERDPETGVPRARIIHRFGRADQVDREALARLVRSISRFLDPSRRSRRRRRVRCACLTRARWAPRGWPTGCGSVFEIGEAIIEAAGGRRLEAQAVERAIFAMVANRLSVRPLSKLAGCGWVAERAFIEGLAEVSDDACYRAMDFLHAALAGLQERVFFTSRSCLTSRSTCCSLTPPRPTGRPTGSPTSCKTTTTMTRHGPEERGFSAAWSRAGGATPSTARITGPTCRRWWSGWRSRARGSRSGCGRSRATRLTR